MEPPEFNASETDDVKGFALDTSRLGKPKVVDGRLVWTPPPDLEPHAVAIIEEAVRAFNRALDQGLHTVDDDGEVK